MSNDTNRSQRLSRVPEDNVIRGLIQQIKLVWRLFRDRRVPVWAKLVPVLSAGYLFLPADLVPDLFLGLGQLDDLAIIALGLKVFLELAPPGVVQEHMNALVASRYQWTVIDGEAEHLDEPQP
jgi:uncharacterized membrane protein YkvA (DUF1232 family)